MEPRFVPQPKHCDLTVHDSKWADEAYAAVGCAGLLLALSLIVDACDGGLALPTALLWISLSVALFVVLLPARVVAAPGRLTVQGLWTRTTVRTDRLAVVRWPDGIEQRLVLTDTEGGRAQIDVRVLLANPPLWLLLEADARTSYEEGTLQEGVRDLDRLARRVERDTTHSVFTISGLH
ncbi:hypothetical protein MBT42_34520 [Streptomyces sp. MBT42]|uniref:hypothetical protein n=1 Tax=Streptomyces sp. MBT42 TaxID=1488373 RepID=UPI001E30061A|nr:hypothetical protein [Streptomyces sp. MBT42]MCD2468651.1 hypothetical protein [Streptomyces sp. MBT42]